MQEETAATMQPNARPAISPSTPVNIPFANAVMHPTTGKEMSYQELITNLDTKAVWTKSAANEFGCLGEGVSNRVKGTEMIRFIPNSSPLPMCHPDDLQPMQDLFATIDHKKKLTRMHQTHCWRQPC